jgi:hypothetical protein
MPITALLLSVVALCFWAVATFFVASQLFRWEPESKIPRKAKLWAASTAIPFLLLGIYENRTGRLAAESKAAYHSVENPGQKRDPARESPADQSPQK